MSVDNMPKPESQAPPSGLKKVVGASMAGTVVEWYEFFLYGTAATLVFSKVFFPGGGNELDAIIAAFITYAVGFAARPLGGIVFGYFGDKFGRKQLLQFSLLLVGAATFLMGCLPTYGQIGYWAPALLVTLRFIQGFAVGGEWGGAVLLVAEHSPNRSRGFWSSWPQAGVPMGNLVATVVLLILTSTLSDESFTSWSVSRRSTAHAVPSISSASDFAATSSRSATVTRAPRAARSRAHASPIPPAPPVTSAVLPESVMRTHRPARRRALARQRRRRTRAIFPWSPARK